MNPIPAENLLPGDPKWRDGRVASGHEIEGYVDRTSARAGDVVNVQVNVDTAQPARWTLYRLGWYAGAGARAVASGEFQAKPQPACLLERETGLVRCSWTPSFSVRIDSAWVSGLYLFAFRRDDDFTRFAPLVITDDRQADLLLQSTENTTQAYNNWQGQSLYADAAGLFPYGISLQASFDRPYIQDGGAGHVLRYEAVMAALLERNGYDVTYTTNGEVSAAGVDLITKRGAYLSVGHDEYWTGESRDAVEAARDQGVPLLFFGANAAYWKIRAEGGPNKANPRLITCFKAVPDDDPIKGKHRTGRYRDDPIARPENALVGTMYESYMHLSTAWRVVNDSSYLYADTGLKNGDTLPFLVGYEYDRVFDNGDSPDGLEVLARSGVVDAYGRPSWSEATSYRAASGALVFGAGSIEFVWGLGDDRHEVDPRVERMTANVLHEALGLAIPPGVGSSGRPAPQAKKLHPASSVDVFSSEIENPTGVAALPDGRAAVTDSQTHQVFFVDESGRATLVVGDGYDSHKPQYDNVPGLRARLRSPVGIVALPWGDVVVADTGNHALRLISKDADHVVSTVAGVLRKAGNADGVGSEARFRSPVGLALDPETGDILVADSGNHRIRRVDPRTWEVTTFAGSGMGYADGTARSVQFVAPTAVAAAVDGRVFVVSTGDSRVVQISADADLTAVTIAGGTRGEADGSGDVATLAPQGGAVWDGTALYVSEPGLNRIRRITPGVDAKTTLVETFVGSGRFGSQTGTGDLAELALPLGLAIRQDGRFLVATPGTSDVRVVKP